MRWVRAFTLGEILGFGLLPATGGALVHLATASSSDAARACAMYLAAVALGFGEGAVLARFQLGPLRARFARVDRRRWVLHSGAAASVAWALGMLGPTLDELTPLPLAVQVTLGVIAGVLVLLSIGGVQARLLREHAERPARWLWANVLGWLLGVPFTFVTPSLVPDDAGPAWFAAAFAVGGGLMGLTAGVVTGFALVWMRPRQPRTRR